VKRQRCDKPFLESAALDVFAFDKLVRHPAGAGKSAARRADGASEAEAFLLEGGKDLAGPLDFVGERSRFQDQPARSERLALPAGQRDGHAVGAEGYENGLGRLSHQPSMPCRLGVLGGAFSEAPAPSDDRKRPERNHGDRGRHGVALWQTEAKTHRRWRRCVAGGDNAPPSNLVHDCPIFIPGCAPPGSWDRF
jgi:hypothetical protein